MRANDGRKLDHQTLEAIRLRAVEQVEAGVPAAQVGELADLIDQTDPRDHGFAVALWTRQIVRQLIAARFGVELTVASVGRTLHDLGFSAQRPLYRAEQADPAAVATWKQIEYPKIAAEARAAGGTVYFVDEAGVRSD